jgi:hypothetical protein
MIASQEHFVKHFQYMNVKQTGNQNTIIYINNKTSYEYIIVKSIATLIHRLNPEPD